MDNVILMPGQFLSTLSLRRATGHGHTGHGGVPFLSTLSLRRATRASSALSLCSVNFYPRSPCGERPDSGIGAWRYRYFYPRSPCGERPCCPASSSTRQVFLSTLSLRRATDGQHRRLSDRQHFYPRSPCGERPHILRWDADHLQPFLSTLSLRRATVLGVLAARPNVDFYPRSPCGERQHRSRSDRWQRHFYPRSPCGERRFLPAVGRQHNAISIHALLAESDPGIQRLVALLRQFLSTLSLRRATQTAYFFYVQKSISIHALLAESDLHSSVSIRFFAQFLSTLSLRRATSITVASVI